MGLFVRSAQDQLSLGVVARINASSRAPGFPPTIPSKSPTPSSKRLGRTQAPGIAVMCGTAEGLLTNDRTARAPGRNVLLQATVAAQLIVNSKCPGATCLAVIHADPQCRLRTSTPSTVH